MQSLTYMSDLARPPEHSKSSSLLSWFSFECGKKVVGNTLRCKKRCSIMNSRSELTFSLNVLDCNASEIALAVEIYPLCVDVTDHPLRREGVVQKVGR